MPGSVPFDYAKYHGLGNDYLVVDPTRFTTRFSMTGPGLPPEAVKLICDRHRGVGADGILLGPLATRDGSPGVRIFNPDGSEAEKSGNGLRIFARYLWDRQATHGKSAFPVATLNGTAGAEIKDYRGRLVSVGVGRYSFQSRDIPVTGDAREVLSEMLEVGTEPVTVCCVTVGNPHCVVIDRNPSPELARRLGPLIERHAWFPNRTNVQFLRIKDRRSIEIQIWERGAGYTQASGTSACAAAAVAVKLGQCEWPVAVQMPGGTLTVAYLPGVGLELTGPVAAVNTGEFAPELLGALGLNRSAAGQAPSRATARPKATVKKAAPKKAALKKSAKAASKPKQQPKKKPAKAMSKAERKALKKAAKAAKKKGGKKK
jgi:diaminopimelate epimerase